ncbi:hypothetical protein H4R18_001348 [Coemansia javaensis]|uniref:Acyltransferase n=1 Tax=Coemansia javaensis TaxID=2761396 RepID=A0A9W8LLH2_9FUNG|nr:hypothetical protein H4R18_001348 [Coemansia javaensis]
MDEFVASVENQEFPLHALDTQAAFMNVPYHFFYANSDEAGDFMPSDALRTSFYRALQRYPILAGNLRCEGQGRTTVVVERDNLNMPEYAESESAMAFGEMREAKFHHSSWPKGLSTVGAITKAGGDGRIKLLSVHVVRMRDNSGLVLFVSCPHYVVDGTGFFSFVELWGTLCRAHRADDAQLAAAAMREPLCFDRAVINRSLPAQRKPLDPDTLRVYTGFSPVADWLAWLSPTTRGALLDRARFSANVESHTFRVARAALGSLRDRVAAHMPEGHPDIVDTHVLAALIAMMVAQAHKKCREGPAASALGSLWGWLAGLAFGAPATQSLHLLADVRHSLDLGGQNYMGNGLLPHTAMCPLAVLEAPLGAETLARATELTSAIYASADGPTVASFLDMLAAQPWCFTRPMIYLSTHPTALVITNETGFKLYNGDFGDGRPEWVCTIPSFVANFIGFLPSPAGSDTEIVVNITLKAPVMRHVLGNEFWRDLATIVY